MKTAIRTTHRIAIILIERQNNYNRNCFNFLRLPQYMLLLCYYSLLNHVLAPSDRKYLTAVLIVADNHLAIS